MTVERRAHPGWCPAAAVALVTAAVAIVAVATGWPDRVAGGPSPAMATSGISRSPEIPKLPPGALLILPDGRRVGGTRGSYEFGGSAADVPWLPTSALMPTALPADSPLSVGFNDGSAVGEWTASVAAAADAQGRDSSGVGGREASQPPLVQVQIGGIRQGNWVLAVRLFLADGSGDGTYFWSLEVR
ncbi:MAG TPA: hypothetical protein VIM30_07120 [Candidatus Limnocylindrales bacterium]